MIRQGTQTIREEVLFGGWYQVPGPKDARSARRVRERVLRAHGERPFSFFLNCSFNVENLDIYHHLLPARQTRTVGVSSRRRRAGLHQSGRHVLRLRVHRASRCKSYIRTTHTE